MCLKNINSIFVLSIIFVFHTLFQFTSFLFLTCNLIPPTGHNIIDLGSNARGTAVSSQTWNSYFDREDTRPTFVCSKPNRIPKTRNKYWTSKLNMHGITASRFLLNLATSKLTAEHCSVVRWPKNLELSSELKNWLCLLPCSHLHALSSTDYIYFPGAYFATFVHKCSWHSFVKYVNVFLWNQSYWRTNRRI